MDTTLEYIDGEDYDVDDKVIPEGKVEKKKTESGRKIWEEPYREFMNRVEKEIMEGATPPSFENKKPFVASIESVKDRNVDVQKKGGIKTWE